MSIAKIISFVLFFVTLNSFGQLKGKSLNLVGTWEYNEGSGYEVWTLKGDELIGAGYRSTKIGDSAKVEDLTISIVNNNHIYTLRTKQQTTMGDSVVVHKFIGNKRKLYFENIDNEMPSSIEYKFGCFNKDKLRITIRFKDIDSPKKLKLTRIKE